MKEAGELKAYRKKRGVWWKNPVPTPAYITLEDMKARVDKYEAELPELLRAREKAKCSNTPNTRAYNTANNAVFSKREQIKMWKRRIEEAEAERKTERENNGT